MLRSTPSSCRARGPADEPYSDFSANRTAPSRSRLRIGFTNCAIFGWLRYRAARAIERFYLGTYTLELYPESELDTPRRIVLPIVADDLPEVGRGRRVVRVAREHRRILRVEGLEPDIGVDPFLDPRVLDHGHVVRGGPLVPDVAPTRRRGLQRVRSANPEHRLLRREQVAHDTCGVDVAGLEQTVPRRILDLRIADHPDIARNTHRA